MRSNKSEFNDKEIVCQMKIADSQIKYKFRRYKIVCQRIVILLSLSKQNKVGMRDDEKI